MKDSIRKEEQQKLIGKIKIDQQKKDHNEIYNDDEERNNGKAGKDDVFNEMRETRTGFGAKVNKKDYNPGQHNAEGGL